MKVLVIGGCGFIGSFLCKSLCNLNFQVDVFDLKNGDLENVKYLKIFDCKDYDLIFHLGGVSSVKSGYENPLKTSEDISFLVNILESIQNTKTKLVYASSFMVFSKELSPYSLSKNTCENYCRIYSKRCNVSIARIANVYPNPNGNICNLIKQKKQNESILIFGDGEQKRDFVHVEDVVSALIKISNMICSTYHICSGELKSFNQLASLLEAKVKYIPFSYKEDVENFPQVNPDIEDWIPHNKIENYLKENANSWSEK